MRKFIHDVVKILFTIAPGLHQKWSIEAQMGQLSVEVITEVLTPWIWNGSISMARHVNSGSGNSRAPLQGVSSNPKQWLAMYFIINSLLLGGRLKFHGQMRSSKESNVQGVVERAMQELIEQAIYLRMLPDLDKRTGAEYYHFKAEGSRNKDLITAAFYMCWSAMKGTPTP